MIFYKIKFEEDKIKILDVIDKDYRPRDKAGVMYVNLVEMNQFNQSLIETEYSSNLDKFL